MDKKLFIGIMIEIILGAIIFTLLFAWDEFIVASIRENPDKEKAKRNEMIYLLIFTVLTVIGIVVAFSYIM